MNDLFLLSKDRRPLYYNKEMAEPDIVHFHTSSNDDYRILNVSIIMNRGTESTQDIRMTHASLFNASALLYRHPFY